MARRPPSSPQRDATQAQNGTQVIRRAAAILRRITHVSGDAPPSLPEISASVGLTRSTTHRILKGLAETGLASYDPATRTYAVGRLGYELGLAVTDGVLDLAPWRAAADRVAARTKATTYLMRRSGVEAVCLHKAEGTAVIRAIPVEVGQRRFLGVGAGATALLSALDDATVERILAAIAPELPRFAALTPDGVRAAVAAARLTGFAISRGMAYQAIFGLGMVVPTTGPSDLAISIAAHEPLATELRVRAWKQAFREEFALAVPDRQAAG